MDSYADKLQNTMSKVSSLNAIYLATIPIIGIYLLPGGIPLNWVLATLLLIINFLSGNFANAFSKRSGETKWFLVILLIGFLGFALNSGNYFSTSLYFNNHATILIFFFSLIVFTAECNTKLFVNTLEVVVVAAAAVAIFQRIQLLLTGSFYVDFFIPGLEVSRDLESFTTNRVSSFFTEPAHLAIYLLPISAILLKQGKILLFGITALGILFSGSTTGFLLLSAIIFIYLISAKVKRIYLFLFAILVGLSAVLIVTYFPDVLLDNVDKLQGSESSDIRLLGPLQHLQLFDPIQWIVGIGLNQLGEFLRSHGIYLVTEWGEEVNANYANAIIYMLISYGLIGFIYTIRYFVKSIKKYRCDLCFLVIILGVLASDQVWFNQNLLYILCFMIFSEDIISFPESQRKI